MFKFKDGLVEHLGSILQLKRSNRIHKPNMFELLEMWKGDADFERMWLSYSRGNIIKAWKAYIMCRLGKQLNKMLGHLPSEYEAVILSQTIEQAYSIYSSPFQSLKSVFLTLPEKNQGLTLRLTKHVLCHCAINWSKNEHKLECKRRIIYNESF